MDWIHSMQKAVSYIENSLFDDINQDDIAKSVYSSSYHFQRIFSMIAGVTIGEYIRNRRLSLAGKELFKTKAKVIDIALKYRYESPESFAKAFTRFHGISPSAAREYENLKTFNPLSIEINMKDCDILDYKIEVKDEFIGNKAKKLEGIHVMYNGTWEETICSDFLNAVVGAMHYIDKSIDSTYIAGVSGAAFNTYWCFGTNNCCDILLMGDKFIEKTFQNSGYFYTHFKKGIYANWNNVVKSKTVESIDNDYPALIRFKDGYGVISGYDNNGSIIDGSKCYFAEEYGYFPRTDYFEIIENVIIINGKNPELSKKELLKNSLEWDIHMSRLPEFFNYENNTKCINGIACYDEIIKLLKDDALYPENDIDRMRYMCEEVFNNFIQYNVNKRKFASGFLCLIAKEFDDSKEELEKAADIYKKVFELYTEAYKDAPTSWLPDEKIIEIKDSVYRNKIAAILGEIKELEIQGVFLMEQALKKINKSNNK
ncbi:MAG: soxS [Clostridia bacterium]|nr:soxS [Clostridia bacterium]